MLDEMEVTGGVLLEEPGFRVRRVQLDHYAPVRAYARELVKTPKVRKDRLQARVSHLVPFHFSRPYQNNPQQLYDELGAVCSRVALPDSMKVFKSPMITGAKPMLKLVPTR